MSFERYSEQNVLQAFDPITLDEMKDVELMNRVDTKFLISRKVFDELLPQLAESYRSLEIKEQRMMEYSTLYFDTPDYRFYLDHHNGKGNRFKVRIRNYVSSGLFFLEIKNKFKGRTNKKRISLKGFEESLEKGSREYISSVIGKEMSLVSKLWNSFDRITLVSKTDKERLTIDLNLAYTSEKGTEVFDHIVIAELKQERLNRNSLFFRLMKQQGIRPGGFSKYCIGAITLDSNLKYNRFKQHQLLLDKLK
jgi:hypothetical protein